ncbi:MAG: anaerobic ribonucleoside-triphosphate reductase [Candidatus Hecatellaceae archaeon]
MHKRVRDAVDIFSAVASPVRVQILRLLSARGPLTYSEIMEQLNLKPSRDAGKFVYHLKNLVSAGLITLERESRRYKITELGTMVNNFFQELMEYTLKKRGRLLVRTSRYTIEEFDRGRITASLVEEAEVPPEIADRISSEAEERLLKLPIRYLTAPLIRELVNAILIEHGLEEYRHKLTRLGMPVHDVTRTIRETSEKGLTVSWVVEAAGKQVLTEYVLLNVLPREVADSHLSGQIHLSNAWDWVLRPQTVHHDLRAFLSGEFKPLSPLTPEARPPENLSDALTLMASVAEAFAWEVSEGQVFEYFNVFLAPYLRGISAERALSLLEAFLQLVSYALGSLNLTLGLEAVVPEHLRKVPLAGGVPGVYGDFEDEARRLLNLILEAAFRLAGGKPPFNVYLTVRLRPEAFQTKSIKELEKAHDLAARYGMPYFANLSAGEASYTASGECLTSDWTGDWEADLLRCGCLGKVALNLPRLAYEARGDKDRLFGLLGQAFKLAVRALAVKAEGLNKRASEGVLPNLSQSGKGEAYFRFRSSAFTICLVGVNEAVKTHLGYWLEEELMPQHFTTEILEFLKGLAKEEGEREGLRVNFSHVVEDEASLRLASLDVERYGWSRVVVQGGRENPYYSYVPLTSEGVNLATKLEVEARLQPLFNGGHFTAIPVGGRPAKALSKQSLNLMEKLNLKFYAYDQPLTYCSACHRTFQGLKVKCPSCGSLNVEAYARQSTRYLPLKWWSHKGKLAALKGG